MTRSQPAVESSDPLAGLRVGLSGAIPEREHWGAVLDLDRIILSFVSQLSALVIEYGGTIVHGSHPALTPVIAEEARERRRSQGERLGEDRKPSLGPGALTLVASRLWGDPPEPTARCAGWSGASVILTPRIGPGDERDAETRNDSLTAMRLALAQQMDVLIAVGGKLHRDTGFNPGILEELTIARWHRVPCFVVACLGGMAGELETGLIGEFSIGNRLNKDDRGRMAQWSGSVDEHVGALITHLCRHRSEFVAKEREGRTFRFAAFGQCRERCRGSGWPRSTRQSCSALERSSAVCRRPSRLPICRVFTGS